MREGVGRVRKVVGDYNGVKQTRHISMKKYILRSLVIYIHVHVQYMYKI